MIKFHLSLVILLFSVSSYSQLSISIKEGEISFMEIQEWNNPDWGNQEVFEAESQSKIIEIK